MRYLSLFLLLAFPQNTRLWHVQCADLDSNLRSVSVFASSNPNTSSIVWASGSKGLILRSTDLGKTWNHLSVPNADKLDFRGIFAVNETTAYLMSIGEGSNSRIYKTSDLGVTWTLQYTADRPAIFLDGIQCISPTHCFAISDPVDGKFFLLSTTDGSHWSELSREKMPAALPKEGIFAASNSAFLATENPATHSTELFFGTGGPAARVFHSSDSGHTWTVSETPLAHSNASSGIFSLCRAGKTLVIVGGDYKATTTATAVAAYSPDDGRIWKLSNTQPGGFRSGVVAFDATSIIAVGTSGTDVSHDLGFNWQPAGPLNLNAATFSPSLHSGWAAGPNGTIAIFKSDDH
jgi:photosystem II stability/assembly factor-like uncharacterized protein